MKKITGATVQEGKFIFIRGLGDRYSTAQLNGNSLPSTDPYRNSAQLDLIPANLLENIITSKTFTPDQPGTFTGGNVNLKTKSYPESMTFNISIGAAYNTQASLIDNFLTHNTDAKTDWLGYDDGTRAFPEILRDPDVLVNLSTRGARLARTDDAIANSIEAASESLNKEFDPEFTTSGLNRKIGISFGNQYTLFGNPLGVLFTANYNRTFSHYDDAISAVYRLNAPGAERLARNFDLNDNRSTDSPSLGGFVGLSYKLGSNNSISFNTIYNHNADKVTRYQSGQHLLNDVSGDDELYETRTLSFRERELLSYQLSGEHVIPGLNKMRIEWSAALSESSMDEPDLRFFANSVGNISNDPNYVIDLSSYASPTHFFRTLVDEQTEFKLDVTLPFLQSKSKSNKFKFGGLVSNKTRDFDESRFEIVEGRESVPYGGIADIYFADDNVGFIGKDDRERNMIANFASDQTDPGNTYDGEQDIWAAYGMATFQLAKKLKVIGGARLESTLISITNTNGLAGDIDKLNLLPTLNFVYELNDKQNLRAAFSQTIARPNMRELAPFNSFEFIGDAVFFGNPDLDQTDILNLDLRWEYFMNPGEIIAVSAYFKEFTNPIIKSVRPFTANPEFEFRNVEDAQVYGVEFEFRKSLGEIAPK
ncbi:MAG: TonB-dependent receptor, partial [Bacteroidota bacterium]